MSAMANTGAAVSVASPSLLQCLGVSTATLAPLPLRVKLRAANGTAMKCLGTLECSLTLVGLPAMENIYICQDVKMFLLSCVACVNLGLISPGFPRPMPHAIIDMLHEAYPQLSLIHI